MPHIQSSPALIQFTRKFLSDVWRAYFTLLKIMVPALVLVKCLDIFGMTHFLATLLSPFMAFVGLPEEMGLVWATSLLTNIYTAMVVFYELAQTQSLSVAQVSCLGLMLLVGHSIPIEGAVAKVGGVPWWVTVLLRVGGSLVIAALANQIYSLGSWQQQAAVMIWQPEVSDGSLVQWALDQLRMFAVILAIIAGLMLLLKLLRFLGVEKLMHWLLSPLLKVLSIGKEATHVTIIGITLGLSFGAGLLFAELKAGHLSKRDAFLSMCFLGLCHSLIEDTLLILLLGADLGAILWGRLLFSILVMAILARVIRFKDKTEPQTVMDTE